MNVTTDPVRPNAPEALETAESGGAPGIEKMGERFVRAGVMTSEQVERVVAFQREHRLRFGQAAVQLGFVSEPMVYAILAEQYGYETAAHGDEQVDLPIAAMPGSPEAEAIRRLRSVISMRLEGKTRFSIAVISPEDRSGRAYLSASLAVAFSQIGRNTLLVNANLRDHGQRDILGRSGRDGLSSILAGRSTAGLVRGIRGFSALGVLDAGPLPPNPAELLREPALRQVFDSYAGQYEIFIVNTPATNTSGDALSIARQVDACVLVARKDLTRVDELENAMELLSSAGANVLGTVYNEYASPPRATRGIAGWVRRLLSA